MTAVAARVADPGLATRARWSVSDSLTIARRNLLVWIRVPAFIVFSVIQPVMFVLMFRYVFGGAIRVPGGYVQFLMPGIIGQTAAFGRMLVTILIMIGVGYAVGFRFSNGVVPAVAMVVLATVFGLAFCCIAAYTGLAIGDEESVQAFGLIWLFPLTFVSSAFVPIASMPGWLQAFANNQPVTYVINTMRALAIGGPVQANLLKSIASLVAIFVVFAPLAVRAYKRAS